MPKVILVGGVPATGKSTMARFLENETGIKRISMDDLKEAIFDLAGYHDREWSKQVGMIAWPTFKQLVELHLSRGEDVIAEATFLWPEDGRWFHSLIEKYEASLYQIWMTANPLVVRERFIYRAHHNRHPGHCDTTDEVIESFTNRFFNRTYLPHPLAGKTLVVDTTDFNQVDSHAVTLFVH
jgi:predicted kinase